jgi:hypothetical protein
VCLGVAGVGGAPPARAAPDKADADAAAWEAAIRAAYRHYERVDVTFGTSGRDPADKCSPADDKLLAQLPFEPWRLRVTLKPHDAHVFAPARITIRRLRAPANGYPIYRRAAQQPAPHHCFVDKTTHLILQSAQWWIELKVPCSAGKLAAYEAADLFEMLRARQGDAPLPAEIIYSYCGRSTIELVSLASLRAEARKTQKFRGLTFPAVRVEAKQKK